MAKKSPAARKSKRTQRKQATKRKRTTQADRAREQVRALEARAESAEATLDRLSRLAAGSLVERVDIDGGPGFAVRAINVENQSKAHGVGKTVTEALDEAGAK